MLQIFLQINDIYDKVLTDKSIGPVHKRAKRSNCKFSSKIKSFFFLTLATTIIKTQVRFCDPVKLSYLYFLNVNKFSNFPEEMFLKLDRLLKFI